MNKIYKTKIGTIKIEEFKTPSNISYWITTPEKGFLLTKQEIKVLIKILGKIK